MLALFPGPAQVIVACSTENLQAMESLGMRLVCTTPTHTHTQLRLFQPNLQPHSYNPFNFFPSITHYTVKAVGCLVHPWYHLTHTFPPSLFPIVHYTQITSPPLSFSHTLPSHTHIPPSPPSLVVLSPHVPFSSETQPEPLAHVPTTHHAPTDCNEHTNIHKIKVGRTQLPTAALGFSCSVELNQTSGK